MWISSVYMTIGLAVCGMYECWESRAYWVIYRFHVCSFNSRVSLQISITEIEWSSIYVFNLSGSYYRLPQLNSTNLIRLWSICKICSGQARKLNNILQMSCKIGSMEWDLYIKFRNNILFTFFFLDFERT